MVRIDETETVDEVLRDVRKIKEELAEVEDFDPGRILRTARQNQQASSRAILAPPESGKD